jgi:penicillin-binding protein A
VNAPLRRVGVVVLVLFGLLFANLNWVQAYKADDYRESRYNGRVQIDKYDRQRGSILAGGNEVALSVETTDNLKYLRTYPFKESYAHLLGFSPVNGRDTALELSEDEFLSGRSDKLIANRVWDMITGKNTPGGNVLLTVSRTAQETAYKELVANKNRASRGAVVALDPTTGGVLAMVSMPSFDPNAITSHDTKAAEAAYKAYEADPLNPLLNRATSEVKPPASTMKVLVSAAALKTGEYNPATPIPAGPTYQAPGTSHVIRNAGASICPEAEVTLEEALTESCNTGYAQLGVKLGADALNQTARDFGFYDQTLTVGRLNDDDGKNVKVVESSLGQLKTSSNGDDKPRIAQSSIGQLDVLMTPMEGAMIASAIANNGSQMRPYVVDQWIGPDLTSKHYVAEPKQLRRSCSPEVAAQLQQMMTSVVEKGTGKNARIDGYQVGGKTGTADSAEEAKAHGWFIGFAMKDGRPVVAVAVFLEEAGKGGSAEAARIAGRVMQGVIADKGGK